MLYKVRQFVNEKTLSIYHVIFDSHLNYAFIVWCQTKSSINREFTIRKNVIRTIHFKCEFHHSSSLFSESNKKLPDKICIENCLFVSKSLNNQLPEIFDNWFIFSSDTHRHQTCSGKGIYA